MICKHCGSEIFKNQKYCQNCGLIADATVIPKKVAPPVVNSVVIPQTNASSTHISNDSSSSNTNTVATNNVASSSGNASANEYNHTSHGHSERGRVIAAIISVLGVVGIIAIIIIANIEDNTDYTKSASAISTEANTSTKSTQQTKDKATTKAITTQERTTTTQAPTTTQAKTTQAPTTTEAVHYDSWVDGVYVADESRNPWSSWSSDMGVFSRSEIVINTISGTINTYQYYYNGENGYAYYDNPFHEQRHVDYSDSVLTFTNGSIMNGDDKKLYMNGDELVLEWLSSESKIYYIKQ